MARSLFYTKNLFQYRTSGFDLQKIFVYGTLLYSYLKCRISLLARFEGLLGFKLLSTLFQKIYGLLFVSKEIKLYGGLHQRI